MNAVSSNRADCKACVRYGPFERATYALEEFVATGKTNKFNSLGQKISTVQQTV